MWGLDKIAWPFVIAGIWCIIFSFGYLILGNTLKQALKKGGIISYYILDSPKAVFLTEYPDFMKILLKIATIPRERTKAGPKTGRGKGESEYITGNQSWPVSFSTTCCRVELREYFNQW